VRRGHHDLLAWQEAMGLAREVYSASCKMPPEEKFGLTSQMRRAAVSVPANIAEGAARGSRKEFAQFLTVARGSLSELETLVILAVDVGQLDEDCGLSVRAHLDRVAGLLNGLITSVRISTAAGKTK